MRRRGGWLALVLILVFAVVHWGWPGKRAGASDDISFYRMKVGLSHKGLPIDFDIVVGCGVRVTEDRYSGASIDILAWYPFVYAKEIAGGHAVMVRATVDGWENDRGSGPCRGSSSFYPGRDGDERPGVAADWLPIIVWYDHADDLSHGLAYVTQDAFESPAAELEFHGATIERATRADFDRFMATAPRNLVPAYNAGSLSSRVAPLFLKASDVPPEAVANPRLAWPHSDRPRCRGVERIRLTEQQRSQIRALWPADHPRYWSASPVDQPKLRGAIFDGPDYSHELFRYSAPDTPERKARRPAVYPLTPSFSLARLDKDTGKNGYTMDAEIGDGLSRKGMLSCDVDAPPAVEEKVTGRAPYGSTRYNGHVCRIDGVTVPALGDACLGAADARWIAFENDEYAISSSDLDLLIL